MLASSYGERGGRGGEGGNRIFSSKGEGEILEEKKKNGVTRRVRHGRVPDTVEKAVFGRGGEKRVTSKGCVGGLMMWVVSETAKKKGGIRKLALLLREKRN